MERSLFPILNSERLGFSLRAVPWAMVEPHREQAMKNHDQTLEELARRGGLDPVELLAVLQGRQILPGYSVQAIFAAESAIVKMMNKPASGCADGSY